MRINADLSQVGADATVVLANNRQVIAFKHSYYQEHGSVALPKVVAWRDYLKSRWQALNQQSELRLLSEFEVRQQLGSIAQATDDPRLVSEIVKNYAYVRDHQIALDELAQSHYPISARFANWVADYQQHKQRQHQLDLYDVADRLTTEADTPLFLYGFKTLTPLQEQVFAGRHQWLRSKDNTPDVHTSCFEQQEAELRAAAQWARAQLEQTPTDSIAVVIPSLEQQQHQVRMLFDQVFDDHLKEVQHKSYNLSLGTTLGSYPLIQALLNLLTVSIQLANNRIEARCFCQLLASPYMAGYTTEKIARLELSQRLRSLSRDQLSFAQLGQHLNETPMLAQTVAQVVAMSYHKRSPSAWRTCFNQLLEAWGFATERTLSSVEYQLIHKYHESLLTFNQLDAQLPRLGSTQALSQLQALLSHLTFQAQSGQNQVQVLGLLEAEGLQFDQAWVLGMTHDVLPAKLNLTRFIPNALAQAHGVPYTSHELIHADAQKTHQNLQNLAPNVQLSYAQLHGGLAQLPSPLFTFVDAPHTETPKYHPTLDIEQLIDDQAPPLSKTQVHNGVSILKAQTACAFQGFVQRLALLDFEPEHIGLNRLEQGQILHRALEYFYQHIPNHQALMALEDRALIQQIDHSIDQALERQAQDGFSTLERTRLRVIIRRLLQIDKTREGFQVLATEQSLAADVAGLRFNTRLDRIDQLPNGDKIVFDYKTGSTSVSAWCGERISEPQLPIYATTTGSDGMAFIQLKADKVEFKGLARDADALPGNGRSNHQCQDWDQQLDVWQTQLHQASLDFQQGHAAVAPSKGACAYCEYELLCRIEK